MQPEKYNFFTLCYPCRENAKAVAKPSTPNQWDFRPRKSLELAAHGASTHTIPKMLVLLLVTMTQPVIQGFMQRYVYKHCVEKTKFYSQQKNIRENSIQCNLVENALISRNFCDKMIRGNFRYFHTVIQWPKYKQSFQISIWFG